MEYNRSSLFLPPGSVRAILALGISGVALITVILNGEIPQELSTVWAGIVSFYFASKQKGQQ